MHSEIHSQGQVQQGKDKEEKQTVEDIDVQSQRKKALVAKIVIVCLALACVILVIVVLTKSSTYFGFMFTLNTQAVIKLYLRKNYTSFMALLYMSIFGFVIASADTILLFFKFTQKGKLLLFHLGYYIAFLICGSVTLSNKDYNSYMSKLNGLSLTDPACIAASFPLECSLAPSYMSYRSTVTTFFIIFNIMFVGFTALYHYTATILLPFETEVKKPEEVKGSIFNANMNNETFVSEMLDQYA